MKLLTKEIESKMPALGTTDGVPLEQKRIVCKFFDPQGSWTWFVFEGSAVLADGTEVPLTDLRAKDRVDVSFFGMVHGLDREMGYFSLNELASVRGRFGLGIERDLHFSGMTMADVR